MLDLKTTPNTFFPGNCRLYTSRPDLIDGNSDITNGRAREHIVKTDSLFILDIAAKHSSWRPTHCPRNFTKLGTAPSVAFCLQLSLRCPPEPKERKTRAGCWKHKAHFPHAFSDTQLSEQSLERDKSFFLHWLESTKANLHLLAGFFSQKVLAAQAV